MFSQRFGRFCSNTITTILMLYVQIITDKWTNAAGYTPPFPIYSNTTGDQGSRFVDLNGDGRMDFVYHLWTPNKVFKGAFINDPGSETFVSAANFEPPFPVAANNGSDLGTRLLIIFQSYCN